MTKGLVELRDVSIRLRPVVDSYNPNQSEEDRRKERLIRWYDKARILYDIYQINRPFYPEVIFLDVKNFMQIIWRELVQYEMRSPEQGEKHGPEYWKNSEENAKKISEQADGLILKALASFSIVSIFAGGGFLGLSNLCT